MPWFRTMMVSSAIAGNVSTTCDTDAVHHGDLRDAESRHLSHVVEDTTKVVLVREHIGLMRQCGTTALVEVDTRQSVLGAMVCARRCFLTEIG